MSELVVEVDGDAVVKRLAIINHVRDPDPVETYLRVRDVIKKKHATGGDMTFDELCDIAYPMFLNNRYRAQVRNIIVLVYLEIEPDNQDFIIGSFGIRREHIDKVYHYVANWEEYGLGTVVKDESEAA